MAMSRRKDRARTPGLWIATNALPVTGGHPFYQRLNQVLDTHAFDAFVEAQCAPFYAATVGRPSLLPGTYFRLLLIGYFEGDRFGARDCLAHRGFAGAAGLPGAGPGRGPTRALDDFADAAPDRSGDAPGGLYLDPAGARDDRSRQGTDDRIDATMLEANAALRSIVRRDSGETYQEFPDAAGPGVGHRDAHAGRSRAPGSEAPEEGP